MKGFTLIETLLYIALTGSLLAGSIATSYTLLLNARTNTAQLERYDEAVFVLQKIQWALMQAPDHAHILSPTLGAQSNTLTALTADGSRVDLCVAGHALRIREGSDVSLPCSDTSYTPLTHDNSAVSHFTAQFDTSGALTVSATLNNTDHATHVYVP